MNRLLSTAAARIHSALVGPMAPSARAAIWLIELITAALRAAIGLLPGDSTFPLVMLMARRAGLLIFLVVGVGILAVCGTYVVGAALTNRYFAAELAYDEARATAVEAFDADGRWLGILPPGDFRDWSDGSGILPPDHATVVPTSIPPVWRNCTLYLEDRQFDGVSRWLGVDPVAVLKSGYFTLTGRRRRGASTLLMQVTRELADRSPSGREPVGELALRKLAELFGANALARMLAAQDGQAAARLVAMHLPLVIGTTKSQFGMPLYGIELAAQTVFGRPASALSIEQQAVFAAAIKFPVVMAPTGDTHDRPLVARRWARIKERADFCLGQPKFAGDSDVAAARMRLRRLELPNPAADPTLAGLLPKDNALAWRIAVNPVRRALYLAGGNLETARAELNRLYPHADWRGRIQAIRLSISAPEARRFSSATLASLTRLQASMPGLVADISNPKGADANVLLAVQDERSRIRLLYSSNPGLLWRWPSQTASVAKMVAAVYLGSVDMPTTPYCRAPLPGTPQFGDKKACARRQAWIPASSAFARSNNQAINWRLRHAPAGRLAQLASSFQLPSFGATPAATALTLGDFEQTPAEMLRTTQAIGEGLSGGLNTVPEATLVDRVTFVLPDGGLRTDVVRLDPPITADTLRGAFTPRVRGFVSTVLAATSSREGTLWRLNGISRALGGRLYAKTGTYSVQHDTYVVHITGVFMVGNRPWSVLLSIGTSTQRMPLGHNLDAGQFANIVAPALTEAAATSRGD